MDSWHEMILVYSPTHLSSTEMENFTAKLPVVELSPPIRVRQIGLSTRRSRSESHELVTSSSFQGSSQWKLCHPLGSAKLSAQFASAAHRWRYHLLISLRSAEHRPSSASPLGEAGCLFASHERRPNGNPQLCRRCASLKAESYSR